MLKIVSATDWHVPNDSTLLLSGTAMHVGMVKTASAAEVCEETLRCIRAVKPTPGKLYILVNALGAGEYYGSNFNGDFFKEEDLDPPDGTDAYGYKTFLNAGVYRNHQNKDKAKSYGRVICAAYNRRMHRVELIIEIDRDKAKEMGHEDIVKRIDAGEKVAVSMGCHVAYDECSICKNRSKTADDYCEHIKNLKGHVLPDGKKVYMINPKPKFFDLSIVVVGADRSSYVMAKIASAGGRVLSAESAEAAGLREPVRIDMDAVKRKIAFMKQAKTKSIPAQSAEVIDEATNDDDDIDEDDLDSIAGCAPNTGASGLGSVLSSLLSAGVLLRPHEFQRITLVMSGNSPMADALDREGCVFCRARTEDNSVRLPTSFSVPMGLSGIISRLMERRSVFPDQAAPRILMLKTAGAKGRVPRTVVRRNTEVLEKIAALYESYRRQAEESCLQIVASSPFTRVNSYTGGYGVHPDGGKAKLAAAEAETRQAMVLYAARSSYWF